MEEKNWLVKEPDETAQYLSQQLGISLLVAQLLVNRGIFDLGSANKFLFGNLDDLYSPWLMAGMSTAVDRVQEALANNQAITIYGDYDVDGQTATALLVYVLKDLASDPKLVSWYIPERATGYGLNKDALQALNIYTDVLITVDCGITAVEESYYAKELGLDLIITDHHETADVLPHAVAILNPKQQVCNYPCKTLAGVGVAYKFVQALGEVFNKEYKHHLDLVALGTVADIVPLLGENRLITKFGLKQLESREKIGLDSLLQISNIKKEVQSADLGYRLGPRLNAAGRMRVASMGVELLLTDNKEQALELADSLDKENKFRQAVEQEILEEAKQIIEKNGWNEQPVIVVASENWHSGVIGIVASRLVELYYKPTVVIAIENNEGKGSARSIAGFNLFKALTKSQEFLLKFGGHEMAAGLSIDPAQVTEFRQRLIEIAKKYLKPEDYIQKVIIDSEITFAQITERLIEELTILKPYGMGNPRPNLMAKGSVLSWQPVGREANHLKCCLKDSQGIVLDGIGFGLVDKMNDYLGSQEFLKFLVTPQINEWNNQRKIQLQLQDLQPAIVPKNFIDHYLQQYPWKLTKKYYEYSLLNCLAPTLDNKDLNNNEKIINDVRGYWNKVQYLLENVGAQDSVYIYVGSAADALDACREIRINYSGDPSHIGFEHEYLSADEQEELYTMLKNKTIKWLVSTCPNYNSAIKWDHMVFYGLPVTVELVSCLYQQLNDRGELHILYGARERNQLKNYIQQAFPDREKLAMLYHHLSKLNRESILMKTVVEFSEKLQISPGLNFILEVFVELGLIRKQADLIQLLPKPAKKLDLYSSVLYNEGMQRRTETLTYIRQCLERGFLNEFS